MNSKRSPPAFARMPWYPRDFASATRGWPLTARAVYHEALDLQWDAGGSGPGVLPDDPKVLRAMIGATAAEWKKAWQPYVEAKFPQVEGGRQNARLEIHRQEAIKRHLRYQHGAKLTNAKRRGRINGKHSDKEISQ